MSGCVTHNMWYSYNRDTSIGKTILGYKICGITKTYVTWSREVSHLSKISICIFLHFFLILSKCFIFMQTSLQLDIWLQSYKGFVHSTNRIKQRNLNNVFTNISKTTSSTSDSFLLIMSHTLNITLCYSAVFEGYKV